jgi:hypothetical protein
MSDIGAISHNYIEWNDHLSELNDWLLIVRKMRDGLISTQESIEIPASVRIVLQNVANSLDPSHIGVSSLIPLTIKRVLIERIGLSINIASRELSKILAKHSLSVDDFSEQDILLLEDVVASLENEVTTLYNRMHTS